MSEFLPVYMHTGKYASEHNEKELFRASNRENIACKKAIEESIRENFDGMQLNEESVLSVLRKFGTERTAMILANTVLHKTYDGRFSRSNKEWALTVPMPETSTDAFGYNHSMEWVLNSHPAILDVFITLYKIF